MNRILARVDTEFGPGSILSSEKNTLTPANRG
jgi:hypothetical protein